MSHTGRQRRLGGRQGRLQTVPVPLTALQALLQHTQLDFPGPGRLLQLPRPLTHIGHLPAPLHLQPQGHAQLLQGLSVLLPPQFLPVQVRHQLALGPGLVPQPLQVRLGGRGQGLAKGEVGHLPAPQPQLPLGLLQDLGECVSPGARLVGPQLGPVFAGPGLGGGGEGRLKGLPAVGELLPQAPALQLGLQEGGRGLLGLPPHPQQGLPQLPLLLPRFLEP
mmetsp:Transcript_34246/g.49780  ORF Transcript_34246/g.49780 Transcript_34246/m.49780 type:complete len:221 (-) Transcript_34246:177-839(-)